jgi:hypothetical protein
LPEKAPSPEPGPKPSQGLKRDLSREERAEIRTADVIRGMLNTEGWKVYKKILEAHLEGERNKREAPAEKELDGIAQILRSESAKGAIMGLRLALSIPEGILANERILRQKLGLGPEDDPL